MSPTMQIRWVWKLYWRIVSMDSIHAQEKDKGSEVNRSSWFRHIHGFSCLLECLRIVPLREKTNWASGNCCSPGSSWQASCQYVRVGYSVFMFPVFHHRWVGFLVRKQAFLKSLIKRKTSSFELQSQQLHLTRCDFFVALHLTTLMGQLAGLFTFINALFPPC